MKQYLDLLRLSEEINRAFGFSEEPGFDGPRINLGPCGPFALDFITVWNDLSKEAAHIVYSNSENRFAENEAKFSVKLVKWDSGSGDYDYAFNNVRSHFYAWSGDKVVKTTAFEYHNAKNLVVGKLINKS